jgi:hypothetical protein
MLKTVGRRGTTPAADARASSQLRTAPRSTAGVRATRAPGLERTDAQQPLLFVPALAEQFGREHGLLDAFGAAIPCQRREHAPRRQVGWRYGRFDAAYGLRQRPGKKMFDHALPQPMAARRGVNRNLPDEQHIGLIGRDIGRYEACQLPLPGGHDARVAKVPAQKEIGVDGIDIQGRRFSDQPLDLRGIFDFGRPQIEVLQGWVENRRLDERVVDRFQTPTLLLFRTPAGTPRRAG